MAEKPKSSAEKPKPAAEPIADAPKPAGEVARPAPSGTALPPLIIRSQYVKDLSFENPRAPQSFQSMQKQPAIQVGVKVAAVKLGEQDYEVVLTINAEAKDGNDTIFVVELTYAGVFEVGAVPAEHVRPLLLIEGPRLLFPFARNILADATREGGFPPLMLQPIDFVELYRRELNQQAPQAGAARPN
jgi:preprotein translocase subunit SecB